MPASSQLKIDTQSLTRLVNDEASYHKELAQQEQRLSALKQDTSDENAEYLIKQQTKAMDETKAMIPELRHKIQQAVTKLERALETSDAGPTEEVEEARAALDDALLVLSKK